MTFKHYLALMGVGTACAVISWLIVFLAIDPVSAGLPSKILFFTTFMISCVGVLTIVGTVLRVLVIHKGSIVSREAARALRQAVFFSSIILAALVMAAFDYLRWWTMTLIILFFGFLEAFLQTTGRRDH